jgi:hypothetical protein
VGGVPIREKCSTLDIEHFFRLGLFFAQDKSLDQHDHTDPNQDQRTNQGPRDFGFLDDPDSYWDGAEEGQETGSSLGKDSIFGLIFDLWHSR